jgi:LacI family transcriptional regulator
MTTMKQVAATAGVSVATVSRVLTGSAGVGEEVRARVDAAVTRTGYRPNRLARGLRRQTSMVWGLVISDVENSFFTGLVRAVEEEAQAAGYSLVLCHSADSLERETRNVNVLVDEQVAGLIITPHDEQRTDVSAALAAGVRVVAVNCRLASAPVPSVLVDSTGGARTAVEHLLDQGARRVAVLSGEEIRTPHRDRVEGWRRAHRARGLEVDESLVARTGNHSSGMDEALRSLFEVPQPPDALFIASNQLTAHALPHLAERGLRVPEDLLLACFDDLPLASVVGRGGLTVVVQPTAEMGRIAARTLLARLRDPERPVEDVVLGTQLVVRGSSRRD